MDDEHFTPYDPNNAAQFAGMRVFDRADHRERSATGRANRWLHRRRADSHGRVPGVGDALQQHRRRAVDRQDWLAGNHHPLLLVRCHLYSRSRHDSRFAGQQPDRQPAGPAFQPDQLAASLAAAQRTLRRHPNQPWQSDTTSGTVPVTEQVDRQHSDATGKPDVASIPESVQQHAYRDSPLATEQPVRRKNS